MGSSPTLSKLARELFYTEIYDSRSIVLVLSPRQRNLCANAIATHLIARSGPLECSRHD